MMKLWLCRPVEGLPDSDNPWEPWWDKVFGFVVRAETESEARDMAHANARDENGTDYKGGKTGHRNPWQDPKYSTCVELLPEGPAGVVMNDFSGA